MTATVRSSVLEDDDRAVASYLDAYFDRQLVRASVHGEPYRRLWESAQDASHGGKRLRPGLLLLAHRHLAPERDGTRAAAVELAAAFELLHTAFVVHDDVIDRERVRRGRPNVEGRAVVAAIDSGASRDRAHVYGQAAGILVGDLLLSAAHTVVAALPAPDDRRRALLDLLDECVFRAAAGEHEDVWGSVDGRSGESEVLAVIENKTAAYSFSAPLQAGGVLAGAGPAVLAGLGRVGRHLGIAFQLRDDVLGVFGREDVTGKSAIGDLREGKETLLITYARREHGWDGVRAVFGRPDLDEASAGRLREAIRRCGALERVEARIRDEVRAAEAEVRGLDVPAGFTDAILGTLRWVAGRRR